MFDCPISEERETVTILLCLGSHRSGRSGFEYIAYASYLHFSFRMKRGVRKSFRGRGRTRHFGARKNRTLTPSQNSEEATRPTHPETT